MAIRATTVAFLVCCAVLPLSSASADDECQTAIEVGFAPVLASPSPEALRTWATGVAAACTEELGNQSRGECDPLPQCAELDIDALVSDRAALCSGSGTNTLAWKYSVAVPALFTGAVDIPDGHMVGTWDVMTEAGGQEVPWSTGTSTGQVGRTQVTGIAEGVVQVGPLVLKSYDAFIAASCQVDIDVFGNKVSLSTQSEFTVKAGISSLVSVESKGVLCPSAETPSCHMYRRRAFRSSSSAS
jgi:hypothetical protein